MNVGVLGLGLNGKAIANQLAERAEEIDLEKLYLSNRSRNKAEALKEQLGLKNSSLEMEVCDFNNFTAVKENSDIIIFTAGVRGTTDRSTAMARNHLILQEEGLAAKLNEFQGYLINLVNPSDVVTNFILGLTDLSPEKVIGSSHIDTLRYRKLLSEEFKVEPSLVEGIVVGTHNQSMVPVFSQTVIAGTKFYQTKKYCEDPQLEERIRRSLVEYAEERLVKKSSFTEIEVAHAIFEVVRAIKNGGRVVMSVRGSPEEFVHLTNIQVNHSSFKDWWYDKFKGYQFCAGWPIKFVGGRVQKQELKLSEKELEQFLEGLKRTYQRTRELPSEIARLKRKKYLVSSAKCGAALLLSGSLAFGAYSEYVASEYKERREGLQSAINLADYPAAANFNAFLENCDTLSKFLFDRTIPIWNPEAKRHEIEVLRYWILGNQLRAQGKFADAKAKYTLALGYNYDQSLSHLLIGHCYKELGDSKHAEEAYKEALKIEPSNSEGHLALANLLKEMFKYDEAEKEYRRALELDPHNANVYRCLGHFNKDRWREEKKDGFFEAAKLWYESAVRISPQPYNFIALGHLYKDNHKLERAKEKYRKVTDLGKNSNDVKAVAYFNLGDVADLESRTEKAIKYFEETIGLEPHFYHGFAHFRLGMDYKKEGDLDKAFVAFRSALELERDVKPGLDYADRGGVDQVIIQHEAVLDFSDQLTPLERNTLQFHLGSAYLAKAKRTEGGAYSDHFYTQKAADLFDKCWGFGRSSEVTEKVKEILELDPYNKTAQLILDVKRWPGAGGYFGWPGHP